MHRFATNTSLLRNCIFSGCSLLLASLGAYAADQSTPHAAWQVRSAGQLSVPRAAHQLTPLGSDQLLITGGCSDAGCSGIQRSAEIVTISNVRQAASRTLPETASQNTTAPLNMQIARVAHLATALADGRVLVAGGWTGTRTTAEAEVFDPQRRSFVAVTNMLTSRMDATATALTDGSVLIAGGAHATNAPLSASEIFDPLQNRFLTTGAMHRPRAHHVAVRLRDGRVLIAGGLSSRKQATNTAEIYDPVSRRFTQINPMQHARCKHAAVLLQDGRVLIIGGSPDCDEKRRLAQTEIYDPQSQTFAPGPSLINPRYKIVSAATVLASGEVLVGGDAGDVEIWTPGTPAFVRAHGSIGANLAFSTSVALHSGEALVIGGYDQDIRPRSGVWLVAPPMMPAAQSE